MRTIKIGSCSDDVRAWKCFLYGKKLYSGEINDTFDGLTLDATKRFQRSHGILDDGIVGNTTYGKAALDGFNIIEPTSDKNWPGKPDFNPIQNRELIFGKIEFKSASMPSNPEAIIITNGWNKNITSVPIKQLNGISGSPKNNSVLFHKKCSEQLVSLFNEWENAGLLGKIKSWDGAWAPRFIRGSRSVLSNHAYGTAFDINASYNPLGATPKLVEQTGSVRELVQIANKNGFYWGGHFSNRPDGMHFEIAKIL